VLDDLVDELDDFVVVDDSVFVAVDEVELESDDSLELLDSEEPLLDSDEPLLEESLLEESLVEPAGVVVDVLPRLSFLKKPLPLNVTPTGWKTFLTAITSPVSGCAYSVNESSRKDCWTSMVSPVLVNLYT
jgi:hypothetical protein